MKVVLFTVLAVICVVGLVSCQFNGYGNSPYQTGGNNSMMMYGGILFLFLFLILFNQTKSVPLFFGNQSLGVNVQTGGLG